MKEYSKAYQKAYREVENYLDSDGKEDDSVHSVWTSYFNEGKRKTEDLSKDLSLSMTDAENFLKFEPPLDYSRATQQQALVLFKALLVFNALVKEFSTSGAPDLTKHLKLLTDAITKFDRKSDAFDSLKGMMLSASNKGLKKSIVTKLKLVRGILNTRQEMFAASRSALLFAERATSSNVTDVRGQLHSSLKNSFKDMIDAKDNMTDLSGVAFTVQRKNNIGHLINALKQVFEDYSPTTKLKQASSSQRHLMEGLATIKRKRISEQEKIQQQQVLIAQSGLDNDVKTFIEVMSNADVIVNAKDLKTEIGQQLGLTRDQEKAMLGSKTGLTLISAGAGSGKTRVLSGKVVNLIEREDVTPYNIMAVSFSKKSAQDLAEKVKQASGNKIPQMSHTAIGRTTHSVALEIVNRFDSEAGNRDLVSNEYELKTLIDEAIKIVKSTQPTGGAVPAESIFKDTPLHHKGAKRKDLSVLGLLISIEKFREVKNQLQEGEIAISDTLKAIREKIIKNEDLEAGEINLVRNVLEDTPRGGKVLNRAFGGDPKKYRFNTRKKTGSTTTTQWWGHMGVSQEEVKVSAKECQLFITKCKANMVSPTEAYDKVNRANSSAPFLFKSKVYGAYEHLKNERSLQDFDDMLIRAVQVLSLGQNLKEVQSQYKHIIVDEAQDLNPVQHAFFGLISGTMVQGNRLGTKPPKPATEIKEKKDTSYTLIGDENQSIYGFRGATSQEFSSRASEGGGNFEVKTLGINFRSKKGIVDAANKLISTEEGSLGMTCTAIYQGVDTGEESISQDTDHESSLSAASSFAEKVEQGFRTEQETYRASDYGVACRTNAELIPYTLALLEKDIPFVCPVSPFDHPTTKKIVRALSIVGFDFDRYQKDQVGSFYGALLNFHKDMKMGLPKGINTVFKKHLHNRLDEQAILKQYNNLEDTQFVPFAPSDLTSEQSAVNLTLYGVCTDEAMDSYSDAEKKSISMYCVIVRQLNIVSEKKPVDLFDMLMGIKELAPGYTLKSADGQTLKEIIIESAKNSSEEMEQALSSISDDEQIKELKTVDFAIAPLNALRSIFLKGITAKKSVSEILQKIADMSTASLGAKNNSRELTDDRVILDTVHGWKGLEVTHLTVPMVKGKFPYEREEEFDPIIYENQQDFDKQKAEQERKLAYVAITRGKKSVTVQSYSKTNSGKEQEASRYISTLFGQEDCKPARQAKLDIARQILAETAVVRGDDLTETEIDLAIKMFS